MKNVAAKIEAYLAEMRTDLGITDIDEALLRQITEYLGDSIYDRDQALVACSNRKELAQVRQEFLVGYLGLEDSDELDVAIDAVCEQYGRSNRSKDRAIFYYLLAQRYGISANEQDAAVGREWRKLDNTVQFKAADWNNEIQRASSLTVEDAKQIAENNDTISYFFFVRESMFMEGHEGEPVWPERGQFQPGDAVFFSGHPSLGTSPHADLYEKSAWEWGVVLNTAPHTSADWSSEIKRAAKVTVADAMKIAMDDPAIRYFVHAREDLKLGESYTLEAGEAVFFGGEPHYGHAPQADSYEKRSVHWVEPTAGLVPYEQPHWDAEVERHSGLSLAQAKHIAEEDLSIRSLVYVKQRIALEAQTLEPNDALFFSSSFGVGSSPDFDVYTKHTEKLFSHLPEPMTP
ncbi:MAG: DUF2853 family protein [Spirulina sp. SIO3F2]|nr:DUF2853 family protein [Spirulina sp. SIO3F2]